MFAAPRPETEFGSVLRCADVRQYTVEQLLYEEEDLLSGADDDLVSPLDMDITTRSPSLSLPLLLSPFPSFSLPLFSIFLPPSFSVLFPYSSFLSVPPSPSSPFLVFCCSLLYMTMVVLDIPSMGAMMICYLHCRTWNPISLSAD